MGAGQELKTFDIDNSYGMEALARMMTDIEDGDGKAAPVEGIEVRDEFSKSQ